MVRGPWRGVEGRHALATRQGHLGLQLIVAHCVMRPCTCILEVWTTRFRRMSVTSRGVGETVRAWEHFQLKAN